MLVQASTSGSTLASHQDSEPVAHSDRLRRLLIRLDKAELVQLALHWLTSTRPYHIPPRLSRREPLSTLSTDIDAATAENTLRYQAVLDLNEERRARSIDELLLLWSALMVDPKVPKARAVERIVTVDWQDGLSYGMVAEVDLLFGNARRTSRNWTAVKLEYDDGADSRGGSRGIDQLAPQQLRDRFSTELAHYFEHHVHLQSLQQGVDRPQQGKASADLASHHWSSQFTYLRVVLAPSPSDVCATGLHILHIPRSPYVLLSGVLGRGTENREMALSALAQAAGAATINYPKPAAGSLQAKRLELDELGEDRDGNRRTLGELRGKDPVALREVLVSEAGPSSSSAVGNGGSFAVGVAGGGKAREMRSAQGAEDGPLVPPMKRRREQDIYSIGVRVPTPPPAAGEEDEADLTATKRSGRAKLEGSVLRTSNKDNSRRGSPVLTPREDMGKARERITVKMESKREARELFGLGKGRDEDLPRIERIDYELYLGFPKRAPYKRPVIPSSLSDDPGEGQSSGGIKLRIEGTHVLAGLRKLVEAGMDRETGYQAKGEAGEERGGETGGAERLGGLPGWMTEVRGTKVVVERSTRRLDGGDESGEAGRDE